jgi:hypothetical protein
MLIVTWPPLAVVELLEEPLLEQAATVVIPRIATAVRPRVLR